MNPINHHYVAQHVLRRFCDPQGILWTYDKETESMSPGRPKSRASGKHFYSFKGRSGVVDSATIELKFLGKIDNDGSVAIQRLLRRERLTGEQISNFMRFAAAQMIRVESYFRRLDGMLTALLQESAMRMFKHSEVFKARVTQRLRDKAMDEHKIEEFMASLRRGEVDISANRGYIVTSFLRSLDMITAHFCQMKWGFLCGKSTDQAFLLSDNPLVLTDVSEGESRPLGILNRNIEVTMPLSPTTVALARWDEGVGYGTIQSDYISTVNQRTIDQAQRYVYAPYRSEKLLARVVASQGRQAKTRVEKVKHGDATILLSTYSH